jgi:hypothetical protein
MVVLVAVAATLMPMVVVHQLIQDMELLVKDTRADLAVDLTNRDKTAIGAVPVVVQAVEEQMHLIIIPQQHKK